MLKTHKDFLRNTDAGLLVLRLGIGGLLLFHGVDKAINGIDGLAGMLVSMGIPGFMAYGTLFAELVCALLILLGVWTRAASAVVVGNMTVALLTAHLSTLFTITAATGGWSAELPALYLFGAAALCFTGAGKFAITRGTILD